MKALSAAIIFFAFGFAAFAQQPGGLTLPPGFHSSVVAEGLGPIRHLAVRGNGDVYVSTLDNGIIALHLDANHKADQVEHFSAVEGGTGIRFYRGALYATSATGVYRFTFDSSKELVPTSIPEIIVHGMPARDPGFRRENRPLAFDGRGNLFVGLSASANLCTKPVLPVGASTPAGEPPVGLKPCPDLGKRAGVWRFSATKIGQNFPTDGEQMATGIRDGTSLAWSPADGHLYGIMHGVDSTHKFWPSLVSAEAADHISDQMNRITKGTNFGWPYTYYDGVRKVRFVSPAYGGNGKTLAPAGIYSTPVLTFTPRSAPVDLAFYTGNQFPAFYHGGAFIVLHGTRGKSGYDVVFVPFNHDGKAGPPKVFANGFADFASSGGNSRRAKYRPVGVAVGPGGSLYIADSQVGRIWRITYGSKSHQ